jgi:hypothetical protein
LFNRITDLEVIHVTAAQIIAIVGIVLITLVSMYGIWLLARGLAEEGVGLLAQLGWIGAEVVVVGLSLLAVLAIAEKALSVQLSNRTWLPWAVLGLLATHVLADALGRIAGRRRRWRNAGVPYPDV